MSEDIQRIELSCIGAAINSKEARDKILASLSEDHFTSPNTHLIRSIASLDLQGKPVDQDTVCMAINGNKLHFPNSQPYAYLTPVMMHQIDNEVSPASLDFYIETLRKEKAKRRVQEAIKAYSDQNQGEEAKDGLLRALEATVEGHSEAEGKSLTALSEVEIDPTKTLLGNRYLCTEGGMLFVGQSGIGKSSASAQMDALWAIGKPAFGINPARPLKILTIQAENDEGDLAEFAKGILDGLEFSPSERELVGKNTRYVSHKTHTGFEFVQFMERAIRLYKPDLVRIDPLTAYLGEDAKDTKASQTFLRNMINPLLERYQCAAIINHHTPKTNFRDTSSWSATDWMYSGSGDAGITNWARAVLVIDSVKEERGSFKFIAAKRGSRIGWVDGAGDPIYEAYFKHSKKPGVILWEPSEYIEAPKAKEEDYKSKLISLVPLDDIIDKNTLMALASEAGIGQNKAKSVMHTLVHNNILFEHRVKRSHLRDKICLARYKQLEG